MESLCVTTLPLDLTAVAPPRNYDVIFGHGVLQFAPPAQRIDFLRHLAARMHRDSALVFIERLQTPLGRKGGTADYVEEMVAALRTQNIPLPEAEPAFRARLQNVAALRRKRPGACAIGEDFRGWLTAAGFRLEPAAELDHTRTVTLANGESVSMELAIGRLP
jgi:hypothetical protein